MHRSATLALLGVGMVSGIFGSGCAVAPDADLSGKSADELRAIRARLPLPGCVPNFMKCDKGGTDVPECKLYREMYEHPMGRFHRWENCAPDYVDYKKRLNALNIVILAADPPPNCASVPSIVREEYGIADPDPIAAMRLLARGYAWNVPGEPDCMAKMCDWYARNITKQGLPNCEPFKLAGRRENAGRLSPELSNGGPASRPPPSEGIEGGGR